jgi:hypothetical protein
MRHKQGGIRFEFCPPRRGRPSTQRHSSLFLSAHRVSTCPIMVCPAAARTASMPVTERTEGAAHAHRPLRYRSEFPPAIPRRAAPRRARFRFAGSLSIPLHTKLAQSRAQPTRLQFRRLTDGVQSRGVSSQVNDCCTAISARVSQLTTVRHSDASDSSAKCCRTAAMAGHEGLLAANVARGLSVIQRGPNFSIEEIGASNQHLTKRLFPGHAFPADLRRAACRSPCRQGRNPWPSRLSRTYRAPPRPRSS